MRNSMYSICTCDDGVFSCESCDSRMHAYLDHSDILPQCLIFSTFFLSFFVLSSDSFPRHKDKSISRRDPLLSIASSIYCTVVTPPITGSIVYSSACFCYSSSAVWVWIYKRGLYCYKHSARRHQYFFLSYTHQHKHKHTTRPIVYSNVGKSWAVFVFPYQYEKLFHNHDDYHLLER